MKRLFGIVGATAALVTFSTPAHADPIFSPLILGTIFGSTVGTATIAGVSLASITSALVVTAVGRGLRVLR